MREGAFRSLVEREYKCATREGISGDRRASKRLPSFVQNRWDVGQHLLGFQIFDIFGQLLSHFAISSYPSGPNSPVNDMLDTKPQRVGIDHVLKFAGVLALS